MSTTLTRQLAALAAAPSSLLVPERKRNSILFTPSEAAKYDREAFFQIGQEGLMELISINHELFSPFQHSSLFSEASKTIERTVEDESTNNRLNELVENFLTTVSPYLMIKSALKTIEWLIYRFHIEKFNIEAILQCILPFHDTKSFVLIIQVLEIGKYKTHGEWKWLEPYVESGVAVPKAILFENGNVNFVLWLFATLGKFSRVHLQHQTNLRVFIAFMTSTLIGIVTKLNRKLMTKTVHSNNRKAVASALISQIKELLETVKCEEAIRHNEEIHAMAYILIALLQMTMHEIPELTPAIQLHLKPVCKLILRYHPPSQYAEAFLLLNLAAANVEMRSLSIKTLAKGLSGAASLSHEWDLYSIVYKLLASNASQPNKLSSFEIFEWIEKIEMTVEQRSEILREIYMIYKNADSGTKMFKWTKGFLAKFERQYPMEFHIACKVDEQFCHDLSSYRKRKDLGLLSQHPDTTVRAKAVQSILGKALSTKNAKKNVIKPFKVAVKVGREKVAKSKVLIVDKNPAAKLLVDRFADDAAPVVLVLLKSKLKSLQRLFSTETLIERLSIVVTKRINKKCVKISLKKLCAIAKDDASIEQKRKIFMILIPFLFPRQPLAMEYAKCILQSEFAKTDGILNRYNTIMNNEDSTPDEMSKFSYEILTTNTLMSKNFVWGENRIQTPTEVLFTCLYTENSSHIDKIISCAENLNLSSAVGFPVTKENFHECVDLAKKKKKLSLDMVLTTFLKLTPKTREQIQNILLFVWQASESVDNKNACLQFLKIFMKKSFISQEEESKFWYNILLQVSVDNYINEEDCSGLNVKAEYLAIRTLQFVTSFINTITVPKSIEKEKSLGVRALRSRVIQKDSPLKSVTNKEHSDDNCLDIWPILEVLLTQYISHKSNRVRLWSINCIKCMRDKTVDADIKKFILNLLDYEKQIIADELQGETVVARLLSSNQSEVIRNRLMSSVVSLNPDLQIILGTLNIFKHIGSLVFKELTPLAEQLLSSNLESDVLAALFDCYDGSLNSQDVVRKALQHKTTYKKVISKITRDMYEKYEFQDKRNMFSFMVETALECENPEVKVSIQRCVRKWLLDATILSHELVKCIGMQKRNSMSTPAKRKKESLDKNATILEALDAGWTKKTEVVLEFVQSKKNLKNKTKLIVPLFRILKTCILLEEQSPVEYLKQLVLTALTICCQEDENSTKPDSNDWVHFNVELIIDCLRCSRNPQTHHHALILLNYAAKRFPEQVLHGIMSLFTFMGNSILRQDDTYSTQLIQQTVTSIIPTLAKTGRGNVRQFSTNLVSAGIFRVFTSAVQDIPVHRRLPVFTSLVETLEPAESMWQICIIIVDNALNRDKRRSNLNADLELATDLVWKFETKVIILTLEKVLMYLSTLPLYNRELSKEEFQQAKNTQDATSKSVLDFSRKESFRDVQLVILFTLELVSKVCCKFEHCGDTEVQYDSLLEKSLVFSRLVSGINDDKIFRFIAHRNFEILERINAALDPNDFIRVVVSILTRNDISVKKKIMDMLNQRILQKVEWFGDLKILVNLLEPLVEIAQTAADTEENVVLIQTAFLCLKLIAKHTALSNPDEFSIVCELTLEHATNQNRLLCSSALLCMGELFCLKSMILPNLKVVTNAISKALKSCAKQQLLDKEYVEKNSSLSKSEDQNEDHSFMTANLLCLSTMTCFHKLVDQLGSFIGAKFLQKFLTAILKIDGNFGFGEKADNRKKVFHHRLKGLLKSIAAKIPLRNSLQPIRGTFSDLLARPKNIVVLMDLLKENLVATAKPDFTIISGPVCDAFLDEFLSFRDKVSHGTDAVEGLNGDNEVKSTDEMEINSVEDSILDCLITGIVLKMSEGHFRPLYHRIFDWTEDNLNRLITFFRFSAAAAERLKSLFTTFAGYVINKSASFLNVDVRLTRSLLKFFYHIFFNDREGFITTDRFNSLIQPLVDLIESDFVISGQIQIQDLNNTIVQLAVATNDLNRWQYLIELISYKSQHKNSLVRLYIISTLEAAANELGKDFLPLLPPAVPFLADLMGDEDSTVEAETQKMLLKLENIVGEPLQSYFTT